MTKSNRKKSVIYLCCLVICITLLSGCDTIARISYQFSGSGIEAWEDEAIKNGVVSMVEEFYFDRLPEELQTAYREIYVHIMKDEDSGSFMTPIGVDDFWTAYYAVLSDHPEIFWIGSSAQIEESGLTRQIVAYDFQVTVPVESRETMRNNLEAAADECIAQISAEASVYQKIKYVYEYLIRTVEYSSESQDSQNIQSALLYYRSVCAGYSKAFQYILNRMGIFCTYITGKIRDGGDHGWNLVRIDGEYYYVDVTWGDPVFANHMDGYEVSDVINYNYLCCTENDLFKTHIPECSVELPSCTSEAYNYYKLTGKYYDYFDWDATYNALMNSVWNGETYFVIQYGNSESCQTAAYEMFQNGMLNDAGQYLMEINGVSSWNYRYHTDDRFNLITIYWY